MTVEVLTSIRGLEDNVSPTGVKYIVQKCAYNPALWEIKTPNKTGPEELEVQGQWTSNPKAQVYLTRYLQKLWSFSDKATADMKVKKAS